ncbi:FRG domain-containing protein [Enterobacter hormaechei]|nr:FRG domain-containing protein [Enterobacter hormaechei]
MNILETKLFGRVKAPSNVAELIKIAEGPSSRATTVHMWRGQGNIDWPIHSAAYRRLKLTNPVVTELIMRNYEKDLLKRARHKGYGYESGRRLADFEVLAKLQHHGAATRLIDFSRNILVALWFACNSEKGEDGLLFGIHSDFIYGQEGEAEERDYNQIFVDGESNAGATTWEPPAVTKRIAAQSAQFMYSIVKNREMGSLDFDEREDAYLPIAITADMKQKFLSSLEGTFDIRAVTLFPDLDGFCHANTEHFRQWDASRW